MNINANIKIDNLIYTNNNSLSKDLCKDLIKIFEKDSIYYGYEGITAGGMNKNIKDTTDLVFTNHTHIEHWNKIHKMLKNELEYNVIEYLNNLNNNLNEDNNGYSILHSHEFIIPSMQMQKYNKNSGKYIYHNDYQCDFSHFKMRQITFLWYINDVEEGGETEFWKNTKVKPTSGKLVLFPSHWTFPHRGNMPISNDKYIITGWIYEQFDPEITKVYNK